MQQLASAPFQGDPIFAILYRFEREQRDRLVLEMEWPETPPDEPEREPTKADGRRRKRATVPQVRQTKYGEEKLCTQCQEWWPNDGEFFGLVKVQGVVRRVRAHCKACCAAYQPPGGKKRGGQRVAQPAR